MPEGELKIPVCVYVGRGVMHLAVTEKPMVAFQPHHTSHPRMWHAAENDKMWMKLDDTLQALLYPTRVVSTCFVTQESPITLQRHPTPVF